MDEKSYSKVAIDRFMNENLFFKDEKLKKYFDRNEQRDLGKFRARVHQTFSKKDFENVMYVLITDSIRDIILDTVGEITEKFKTSGDLIVSGGEAFNLYVDFNDRIVTSDIDAKFVPHIRADEKYFGKLQALKLLLWDELGKQAKRLNTRIKDRLISMQSKYPKVFKFLGAGFKNSGPYVTRRYTLIKKKKTSDTNRPGKGDVFIDVELFALDLKIRFFSPESGRIMDNTIGGILDIPFMRPKEFGYEVSQTKRKGIVYRNALSGKIINNQKIYVASKEFLVEDIYLMHKLKLRPEKKEKDRRRLVKLGQLFDSKIKASDTIENIYKRVRRKLILKTSRTKIPNGDVSIKKAKKVNPYNYKKYTTEPSKERISKQIVHGLKPVINNTNVEGFEKSNGNRRFNLKTIKWVKESNRAYVKNETPLRPKQAMNIPKNINVTKTLYGYNPNRDKWIDKDVLNHASAIPFIGLKNWWVKLL